MKAGAQSQLQVSDPIFHRTALCPWQNGTMDRHNLVNTDDVVSDTAHSCSASACTEVCQTQTHTSTVVIYEQEA